MKRIILAAVFGIFAATSATSDDANWPRTNHPNPFHSWSVFEQDAFREEAAIQRSSVLYAASSAKRAKPATTINPWGHDYAPFGQAGSMPTGGLQSAFVPSTGTTTKELDARARYLRAARRESYRGLDCNSDIQPVDASAYCFNAFIHNGTNSPLGASAN